MPTSTVSGLLEFSTCYNFISSRQKKFKKKEIVNVKLFEHSSLRCKVGLSCDVYDLA